MCDDRDAFVRASYKDALVGIIGGILGIGATMISIGTLVYNWVTRTREQETMRDE